MPEVVEELEQWGELEQPQPSVEVKDLTPWWLLPDAVAPVICHVSPVTGEFLGQGVADPSPLEPGVWLLPAHGHEVALPDISRDLTAVIAPSGHDWSYVADFRGMTVYSTETRESFVWVQLGDLPNTVTLLAAGEFDKWDGEKWVLDEAAQAAELTRLATRKKVLLTQFAVTKISALQNAVDLGIATESEVEALKAWKLYSVFLDRLQPDAVSAPSDWPTSPDDRALLGWLEAQGYTDPPSSAQTETP
jgi:hypothetical protein